MNPIKKIHYAFAAVFLFATEVYIAVNVDDAFIRPFLGDFLVVILIYCVLMSLTPFRVLPGLIIVFLFSVVVEVLQLTNLSSMAASALGNWVRIVLGHQFSWLDLVMYALGLLFTGALEWIIRYAFGNDRNELHTGTRW